MQVFAIGHSNYPIEKLIDMLNQYNINCVVDIRETPYSRYNIQYNREDFCKTLRKEGFIYIYMGKEFGARRGSKESYNREGFADFEKVSKEDIFKKGIERIKDGCKKGYKIALLGAMQDPIRCHRSILVGRRLNENGINVKYILHEGDVAEQEDIENQLLDKYFSERNQITIDSLIGNSMSKEDMINEAYRLANKEIGYRTEGISK
ncbi:MULTISPECIES: DUF488 domain-containing protein [unclassified Romboutsia]|uniref:DUF488 domain-containing protein n=1 Tax=unclassified Romboutsia TaxID=2626894 RepID=UPI001898FB41|nr:MULTISPECIES: DUF488 domain-containing protein [unclassified Romboutsia]MDB8790377.1 DUF488 domain-containing protein [Romboutsia sp. 1001216sp1]MDB8802834.1 DUF488 domain-containing protein [Romboutsia sp. 1001216sp1]MDB8805784.1 DUF488 domain-containing protein [Romboutsia sp. 1001216sp1]MDB8808268.1 DUF488 domain-containing protein [Romboutsia sp. 1001216sp1]MDB8811537.1 DUF488 domain-containing protein [Romboutsia sp. 1001216sp1]